MNIPKKPLTLLLALVMAIGLTAAAFAAEEPRYTDVTEKNWYHDAVVFVTEKKLMDGLTDDTFGPSRNLTRQMLATALYRLAGSPAVEADNPFTDVADGAAYRDAVVWAYSTGVVNGTSETTFSPDSAIERQAGPLSGRRHLRRGGSGWFQGRSRHPQLRQGVPLLGGSQQADPGQPGRHGQPQGQRHPRPGRRHPPALFRSGRK